MGPAAHPDALAEIIVRTLRAARQLIDGIDEAEVREALADLEKSLMVRQGEGGYRIPTPAEDDWEQTRSAIEPKRADEKRLYASVPSEFWAPQPNFTLDDAKVFKAGLMVGGNEVVSGEIPSISNWRTLLKRP